jgi:hypothetical protein
VLEPFAISRDEHLYHAWPDVALTPSGRLVCVFSECRHHADRGPTRVMVVTSDDRGRTWTPKRPVTQVLERKGPDDPIWNCARVTALSDGRLALIVDRVAGAREGSQGGEQSNWLWFSADEGDSWQGPHHTPVWGIVPDRLIELKHGPHAGRWILSAHTAMECHGERTFVEWCWLSDDRGETWQGPITIARDPRYKLCEGSIVELPAGELVCFLRENSGQGWDAFKSVSVDGGLTWSELVMFPLPGCHRPVAGVLQSGEVFITHRFMQGGKGWAGWWTQNLFGALTDTASCLATTRGEAHTRILPIDFDRSPASDTGYTGWVQFDDGEIYIVNYIVDDHHPLAQIRGYSLRLGDFVLPQRPADQEAGQPTPTKAVKAKVSVHSAVRRRTPMPFNT